MQYKLLWGLAAAIAVGAMPTSTSRASALFTSDSSGNTVDGNIYCSKDEVYLNGGPNNNEDAATTWPAGDYCVYVTDPSDTPVLGTGVILGHLGGAFSHQQLNSIAPFLDPRKPRGSVQSLGLQETDRRRMSFRSQRSTVGL